MSEVVFTILVLCTGNICRSPFAAAHLENLALDAGLKFDIRSRGLAACTGSQVPPATWEAAKTFGIDLHSHLGKQVEPKDFKWADEIMVMEPWQKASVRTSSPTSRVTGLWSYLPRANEIPDPYQGGPKAHRQTAILLDQALQNWLTNRLK